MKTNSANNFDVAVIGAGVFGAWIAWHLARRGQRVLLLDAYGVAHARSSSGGESRIIRMGYGADELYTRWAIRSLVQWKELFAGQEDTLFYETGVLWLGSEADERLGETAATLNRCAVQYEEVDRAGLEKRYPQISFDGISTGLFEPHSGALMARRAVAAVVRSGMQSGVEYRAAQILAPRGDKRVTHITTGADGNIHANHFVFACGAWLGKVFPDILDARIFPARQEVFFFGIPAGDTRFAAPALPTWLFQSDQYYGMPDIESRGLKIAFDGHGPRVDPDTQSRMASEEAAQKAKEYVARRFPALRDAPIVETRVCQYENTSNGDFLIDRHPQMENVWIAGGGSGHGFKHGPAVGEYVAAQVLDGGPIEPRFSFSTKGTAQRREIY